MTRVQQVLIAAAVALSPKTVRATRREQWSADCRDAAELGLSSWSVTAGALTTSILSRRLPEPVDDTVTEMKEQHMNSLLKPSWRPATRLVAGALISASLATGVIATGASWIRSELDTVSRAATLGPLAGPVTWASLDEGPASEWTDTSKLVIVDTATP